MNAIILAAGKGVKAGEENKRIPVCLMKVDNKAILKRQLDILKKVGITGHVVVIGKEGASWSKKNIDEIKRITSHVEVNADNATTPSTSSIAAGLRHFSPSQTFIMDGDTLFEERLIRAMISHKGNNVLLIEKSKPPISGTKVRVQEGCVREIGTGVDSGDVYTGMIKIGPSLFKSLKSMLEDKSSQKIHFGSILNKLLKTKKLMALHIRDIDGAVGDVLDFKPLTGGSYAHTNVISKMIKKTAYVLRKEAEGAGRQKLIEEVLWIKNLPSDLKPYFPELIDYDLTSKKVWVEMDYHHLPTLRSLLVDRSITGKTAVYLLTQMINLMFSKVYCKKSDKAVSGFAQRVHLDRIVARLEEIKSRSPIMAQIVNAKTIVINDKRYLNIPALTAELQKDKVLLDRLEPPYVGTVHGDLHFDNFLVDIQQMPMAKFILFDPRGKNDTYDYSYDLGKLWHSFHSKYDLFHEGLYALAYEVHGDKVVARLEITDKELLKTYQYIHREFPKVVEKIPALGKDKEWKMRTLFSEMAHLCSVVPFHLSGDDEERLAVALYLIGVKRINEFMSKYGRLRNGFWGNR